MNIYNRLSTATDEHGTIAGVNDAYTRTVQASRNIEFALRAAGVSLEDVVRTRIYVVNIDDWEVIARAPEEVFQKIRPATSMAEVRRLISPEILVEIEADAIAGAGLNEPS